MAEGRRVAGVGEATANMDRSDDLDRRRVVSIARQVQLENQLIIILPFQSDPEIVAIGLCRVVENR